MKRVLFLLVIGIFFSLGFIQNSQAASQDECAIWICLPGGFPSGCSGAHSEFRDRIRKGRSPLPSLSSCTVDGTTTGRYELGVEFFEPCEDGYFLQERTRVTALNNRNAGFCVVDSCPERVRHLAGVCQEYPAVRRSEPQFVKMWVDGEYIGQFFY